MSKFTPPISVQLYTLREESAKNFDRILSQLAEIGYQGVEPFNLYGKTPREFRSQVENLGMEISSTHFPWMNRVEDVGQAADIIQEMGLKRAPGGFGPNDFKDMDSIKRTIETTADLVERLKPYGITLCLHNHWWEYNKIDGQIGYHYLQNQVSEVEFEIDTYWAANFGQCDPAEEIRRVNSRTPLIHVKDGPLTKDHANVAVGDGTMDIPALFDAADQDVLEWAVVELDKCDGDMFAAVAQSYNFLTNNNLTSGQN